MGMQLDNKRYTGALADINVTPLVDVILVLLIIFMMAAPVVLQGLQTNLPKAIVSDMEIDSDQVVVTITLNKMTSTARTSPVSYNARSPQAVKTMCISAPIKI